MPTDVEHFRLVDALAERRGRRFGLGMRIPSGASALLALRLVPATRRGQLAAA